MVWQLIRTLTMLTVVLTLAWWSIRFMGQRTGAAGGRARLLRVLEAVPVGRDRSILLVEVGGRIYLVGATGERISLLDAIAEPEVVERILGGVPSDFQPGAAHLLPAQFRELLASARTRLVARDRTPMELSDEQETDRMEERVDRLNRALRGQGQA